MRRIGEKEKKRKTHKKKNNGNWSSSVLAWPLQQESSQKAYTPLDRKKVESLDKHDFRSQKIVESMKKTPWP